MSEPTTYPQPFGSYVLLEHLGRGGMADVELARRVVDDAGFVRFLVIKRIQPKHADNSSFVRMFTDEARISAELQQENIAQVYDFGQITDQYFLAMEYVPGVNLRHVQRILASRGQVPPFRVTFRVLADVLSALQYAHNRVDTYGRAMRLVHRDVNPRNVMLSVRGEVKLIDFGVAKADIRAEHTVGKSMKGKFAYMAPEQIEGNVPVDGRTDLFAVGLVMHELVAGRSPFAGMSEAQIVHQTVLGPVPPLKVPGLYPDAELLRGIHDRALAKNMEDRYADGAAMREDIVRAANAVGGLASREEMAEFLRKVAPDDVAQITNRLKTYRDLTPLPSMPPPEPKPAPVEPADRAEPTIVPEGTRPSQQLPVEEEAPGHPLAWIGVLALSVLSGLALALAFVLPPRPTTTTELTTTTESTSQEGAEVTPPQTSETTAPLETDPQVPPEVEDDPETPGSRPKEPRLAVVTANPDQGKPAEPPEVVAEAPKEGFLNVSSAPDRGLEVYVDGQRVGVTPIKSLRVPTGDHVVLIKDERSGRSWERKVTVTEGNAAVVSTRSAP